MTVHVVPVQAVAVASPAQTKEVAAGVQLAVRVDEPPDPIAAGDAARVQAGTATVTVSVYVALLPAPRLLLPVTE